MKVMSSLFGGQRLTVREAALRRRASAGMPRLVGTPVDVADELERLAGASACDGLDVTGTHTPASYECEYTGATLRENLVG